MNKNKATGLGLVAILLWSAVIGLLRVVSEYFGAVGGAALAFSLAFLLPMFMLGPTRPRDLPFLYLIFGTALFVSYELCLSLSIGLAQTSQQAIEVGTVNYLWPTLTIVMAIVFNTQRTNILIFPGIATSMYGIASVLGGEGGIDIHEMTGNISRNPWSYGLAFAGAVIWSCYCTATVRIAKGKMALQFSFPCWQSFYG